MPALAADEFPIAGFSSATPGQPPGAWKFSTLPNKKATGFSVVELDGARVLKVEADDSYGNLSHAMRAQVSDKSMLVWKWRVAFDAGKLSLGERAKLALAHNSTGQDVPTETLCYVWDNKLAEGTHLANAFTKRIRLLVLQSGSAKLGQWQSQRRNLSADYLRAFADETDGKVPEVVGVAVSADADNTHGKGLAYVGDVTLTP